MNYILLSKEDLPHDGNTYEFVSALKTFLDKNFAQMMRECQHLIELNAITNNLWLEVIDDVAKGRSPSGHHMKYTSLGSGLRPTVPAVALPPLRRF